MIIDMHIHTNFSACSVIKIPDLLRRASKMDLDGLCITDHDTIASKHILDTLDETEGLCIILGMEYTTPKGDFLIFGPIDYIPQRMEAEDLVQWVYKEGGVAIPAHPFRSSRPANINILLSHDIRIVESMNGRNLSSENDKCRSWLSRHGNGTREIGGSDAHTLGEVGQIVTKFDRDIYNAEELIAELKTGRYFPLKRSAA